MQSKILLTAILALLAGCATFKELEPKPEVFPFERGYIELKNDKENFQLDQGKHYFIRFPRPSQDNFYLVLQMSAKRAINSYLTRSFDDGKEPITRMIDETTSADSISVYAIDPASNTYFWVIDTVRVDIELRLRYRYVPRWRYTFENKYVLFRQTLGDNIVDRSTYLSASGAPAIESLDFAKALESLRSHSSRLSSMYGELKGVGSLFPPGIAATNDTAYKNYTALRASVEDELTFQQNYETALSVFQKEKNSWGNTGTFLADAGTFAEFLEKKDRYPAPIVEKARRAFIGRLGDVVPYYVRQLRAKKDARPFKASPPLEPVGRLFRACAGSIPPAFEGLETFTKRFNLEAEALRSANERLAELNALIDKTVAPPPPSMYANVAVTAHDIRASIPASEAASFEAYRDLEATGLVALGLGKAAEQADDLQALFDAAGRVAGDITTRSWGLAESRTREIMQGNNGANYASVPRYRDKIVHWFEADIFNGVMGATRERLDAFVKLNETTVTDVPRLYADSAFFPVYQLSFSSAGQADLSRKRAQIDDYCERIRHYQFPESAIRAIYADFAREMNGSGGVDRARAIVAHGAMYKGNDKQLISIVSECDPQAAKWIVRPKEYRRILALPVTSNLRGTNEYLFRIKLEIPSDAQFPVFDVNIKLPRELAGGASRQQWYDRITINKSPIKNEGRFRITSPSADNDYESQITPVQMDKEGNNILEIHFTKASYRVYEISAMAQVPIMKKN